MVDELPVDVQDQGSHRGLFEVGLAGRAHQVSFGQRLDTGDPCRRQVVELGQRVGGESGINRCETASWTVQWRSGRFASGVRSFYTSVSSIQRLRCNRSAWVLVGRGGSMRRFVTLVFLLLFTIPFGISISGCGKKSSITYCEGSSGPIVGQATTVTLTPKIFGVSMNFAQIGQVSAPSNQ